MNNKDMLLEELKKLTSSVDLKKAEVYNLTIEYTPGSVTGSHVRIVADIFVKDED